MKNPERARPPGRSRGLGLMDAVLALGLFGLGLLAFSHLQAGLRADSAAARAQLEQARPVLDQLEAWRPPREVPDWAEGLPAGLAAGTRWALSSDPDLRSVWMQSAARPGAPSLGLGTLLTIGPPGEAAWRFRPGAAGGQGAGGLGLPWRLPPGLATVGALLDETAPASLVRWLVADGPVLQVDPGSGRLDALCGPAPPERLHCEPHPGWLLAGHLLDDASPESRAMLAAWSGLAVVDDDNTLTARAACQLDPVGPGPGLLRHRGFLCWLPTRLSGGPWTGRPEPRLPPTPPQAIAGPLRLCALVEGLAAAFVPARGRYENVAASLRAQRFQLHAAPACPPGQLPLEAPGPAESGHVPPAPSAPASGPAAGSARHRGAGPLDAVRPGPHPARGAARPAPGGSADAGAGGPGHRPVGAQPARGLRHPGPGRPPARRRPHPGSRRAACGSDGPARRPGRWP